MSEGFADLAEGRREGLQARALQPAGADFLALAVNDEP